MQIEISKKYRDVENFDRINTVLKFLEEFLKNIITN